MRGCAPAGRPLRLGINTRDDAPPHEGRPEGRYNAIVILIYSHLRPYCCYNERLCPCGQTFETRYKCLKSRRLVR